MTSIKLSFSGSVIVVSHEKAFLQSWPDRVLDISLLTYAESETEQESPFARKISKKYLKLTPSEIEVANLIRYGFNSKEIADIMNLSPRTIYNYRENIRKKFGLENKKTDLRSHLLSLH